MVNLPPSKSNEQSPTGSTTRPQPATFSSGFTSSGLTSAAQAGSPLNRNTSNQPRTVISHMAHLLQFVKLARRHFESFFDDVLIDPDVVLAHWNDHQITVLLGILSRVAGARGLGTSRGNHEYLFHSARALHPDQPQIIFWLD